MHRYLVKVFIILEGIPEDAYWEVVIGAQNESDAWLYFNTMWSGLTGTAFSRTITEINE